MTSSDIHLLPICVTEYADGYTIAGGTACNDDSQTDEDRCSVACNTALHPYAVTCAKCLASPLYEPYLEAYERGTPPPYTFEAVATIADKIYRNKGKYNLEANNRHRAWLGLEAIFPSHELRERLLDERRLQKERYKNHKTKSKEVNSYMRENGIVGDVEVRRSYNMVTGEQSEDIVVMERDNGKPQISKIIFSIEYGFVRPIGNSFLKRIGNEIARLLK